MKQIKIIAVLMMLSFAAIADTAWISAPYVITQPGTYSNLFIKSTSFGTPCIQVNPQGSGIYVIAKCVLVGAGDLIDVNGNSRITITKNKLHNLPSTDAAQSGKAIYIYNPYSVDIENNELSTTGGINVQGWKGGVGDSLVIRYNKSRNVDGRTSLNKEGRARHFIWLNTCYNISGSDISWNENIDVPDSSVEQDVVNFYNSSGVASSPINLHDNYFFGVYPFPSSLQKTSGDGMITDGDNPISPFTAKTIKTLATTTGYIHAYDNQFVGMGNAGMNIANGHDIRYNRNRIIGSGYFPNGTKYTGVWAGVCAWNSSHIPDSLFYNNSIDSNYIGYTSWGQNYTDPRTGITYTNRQDENNTSTNVMKRWVNFFAPNVPVTLADEAREYALWQAKIKVAGVHLGLDSANAVIAVIPPVIADTVAKQTPCAPVVRDSIVYVPYAVHDTVKISYPVHDTTRIWMIPSIPYKPSTTPPQSKNNIPLKQFVPMKHEETV